MERARTKFLENARRAGVRSAQRALSQSRRHDAAGGPRRVRPRRPSRRKCARKYGPGLFGQGCLLARRLVERGVPFVEVGLGEGLGWDTHADNFTTFERLSGGARLRLGDADDASCTSATCSRARRSCGSASSAARRNQSASRPRPLPERPGRACSPAAASQGGQAYGRTSADGTTVEENTVAIGDVLATLCTALGVPPESENMTPEDRPIKIAEGTPIDAILA